MKLLLLTTTFFMTSFAFAGLPILKNIPVKHIYIPKGFDSNDNVEVVVTGTLPNLCHKAPQVEIKKTEHDISVSLKTLYYSKSNPYCPEMAVPFSKVISLGSFKPGIYEIIVNKDSDFEKLENLMVRSPKSDSIDEYQYAYVDTIKKNLDKKTVTLSGYNPSDCFEISKVDYLSNEQDTYSILPRMKQISDFCPMKLTPFSITWKIPKERLDSKKVLLHVRTLNGNSLNKIINNF